MKLNAELFHQAIDEIEEKKRISKEEVIEALKDAMARGYRKELGGDDALVRVDIDYENGIIDMYQIKMVVEDVQDDFLEISTEDAKKIDKKLKAGDEYLIPAKIEDLRKATAMSVKAIMRQKFAEAEKAILFDEFKDKIHTMITGKVESIDDRGCSVNIGRTTVYLPRKQMIGDENFALQDNIKLYVADVGAGRQGAHIIVTRSGEGFLQKLFEEEIHDVYDHTIEIKSIAREAGERSKVAVYCADPNIDPAGSCIGPGGSKIQKVVNQLGNGSNKEKIDIIAYSEVPGLFIMEALKPARVAGVIVDEENRSATAIVEDDSLSLAIGRRGVNVRLAVKLTNYKIDIKIKSEALEAGLTYQTFEELQALDMEKRNQARMAELALKKEEALQSATSTATVLPGLPEGYVAPQARKYEDDTTNNEVDEVLEEKLDDEEAETVAPIKEENETPVTPKVEEPTEVKVKTTTSLEDLEKSLAASANKEEKKSFKKFTRKNKDEDKEEEKIETVTSKSQNEARMDIYTEEEKKAMELEDAEAENEEYEEEEVDYDDYDEYYDK